MLYHWPSWTDWAADPLLSESTVSSVHSPDMNSCITSAHRGGGLQKHQCRVVTCIRRGGERSQWHHRSHHTISWEKARLWARSRYRVMGQSHVVMATSLGRNNLDLLDYVKQSFKYPDVKFKPKPYYRARAVHPDSVTSGRPGLTARCSGWVQTWRHPPVLDTIRKRGLNYLDWASCSPSSGTNMHNRLLSRCSGKRWCRGQTLVKRSCD